MARPRKQVAVDVELPAPDRDGRILITGRTAALVACTTPATVLRWKAEGILKAAGQEQDGRRQLLFDYADVIEADAIARGLLVAA